MRKLYDQKKKKDLGKEKLEKEKEGNGKKVKKAKKRLIAIEKVDVTIKKKKLAFLAKAC